MSKSKLNVARMSLRLQITLVTMALLFATVAAMAFMGYRSLGDKITADIEARTLSSLRVASRFLTQGAPIFDVVNNAAGEPEQLRLKWGEDAFDSLPDNELTEVVDQISVVNHGTATVFRWDVAKSDFVRIATTVKKPDGSRATGTVLGQTGVVYPYMMRKEAYRGVALILGEPYQTGYLPILSRDDKPIGILYIGVGKIAELSAAAEAFQNKALLVGLAVFLVAAAFTFGIVPRLFRPIREVASATARLATGQTDTEIPGVERNDEVGTIARAVEGFRDAVRDRHVIEAERFAAAEKMAQRKEEMERLVSAFRSRVETDMGELRNGNRSVLSTSGQIREILSMAGTRTQEGRRAVVSGEAAVAEVAQATGQYAGSIQEIASRSSDAASVVQKAAQSGARAASTVTELSNVVDQITKAVGFISSIAAQTNLLALNATIEAARAGEAGRGFAIVASEVKELSNGTAKAAAEIVELVRGIQGVTTAVTEATTGIGTDLDHINQTTMAIAAAVAEQEQVTQGIAANATLAADGTIVIREGFEAIETAIQETTRAADSLDAVSAGVARTTETLIEGIEDFLATMAA